MSLYQVSRTLLMAATLGLAACAGGPSVAMKSADRAAVRSIDINSSVTVPSDMFFNGRAQSIAAGLGGVVGALVSEAAAKEPKQILLEEMKQNDISVEAIVKAEFIKAARESTSMTVTEGAPGADAELALVVNIYGFGQAQGFSALLYPMMNISATLTRPGGTVIWRKTDFASPLNAQNKSGFEFDQYVKDPELLRGAIVSISSIVSHLLVSDLKTAH